jgi:hypothetical protein
MMSGVRPILLRPRAACFQDGLAWLSHEFAGVVSLQLFDEHATTGCFRGFESLFEEGCQLHF